MRQALYDQIASILSLDRASLDRVIQKHPEIDSKTLLAIYLRKAQNLYRVAHANLTALNHPVDYFYLQFRAEALRRQQQQQQPADSCIVHTVIRDMGEQVGLPPCLMARFVIKSFLMMNSTSPIADASLGEESIDLENTNTATPNNITSSNDSVSTSRVSEFIKNPALLKDVDDILALNIEYCLQNDVLTSPSMDVYRHQVGLEREEFMHRCLQEGGVLFHSETAMRAAGYPKTPDALLAYPVEIDGHIVNWIESKALFGDFSAHAMYLRDQYWPYYNRFGPGLVIYWFGFIDELNVDRERGILLMDRFPDSLNKIVLKE